MNLFEGIKTLSHADIVPCCIAICIFTTLPVDNLWVYLKDNRIRDTSFLHGDIHHRMLCRETHSDIFLKIVSTIQGA